MPSLKAFAAAVAAVAVAVAVATSAVSPDSARTVVDHGQNWQASPEAFHSWMAEGGEQTALHGAEDIPELRQKLVKRVISFAQEYLGSASVYEEAAAWLAGSVGWSTNAAPTQGEIRSVLEEVAKGGDVHPLETGADGEFSPLGSNPYPYFNFMPTLMGKAIPGGAAATFETSCWGSNTLTASAPSNGQVAITLSVDQQKGFLCSDSYLVASVGSIKLGFSVGSRGDHALTWNVSASTPAELHDVTTRGVRFFLLPGSTLSNIGDLINTALLFLPLTSKGVDASSAARNVDFLSKYANVHMENRTTYEVTIDESTINSGDFFGIVRLDGLDPMLGWAMGSSTGHTTVAIRKNGTLFVAESTANDSYWPTNGIQMTPWKTWIQQAHDAGFNLVHAPLKKTVPFDADKALEWYSTVEGLNYGYHNMLFGWIDTLNQNYPCVAPDFKRCLTFEIVEVLFGLIDKIAPTASDLIFNEAMNIRLGTSGLRMAELLQEADTRKIDPQTIPAIVEQDAWVYNTTRYGKPAQGRSMVCCVFVCSMWKAAGVFGDITDEVQCGEQTNWDDYSMDILDMPARPPQCVKADPNNQLCQLEGAYTLNLNNYTSRTPYAHMDESCPSEAPYYPRSKTC